MTYAVLDKLLNNEKSGVLYLALQNSGLGGSIDGEIDMSSLQWTFDLQVTNIGANDTDAVEDIVRDTLQATAKNGFHQEDIESAINTVEFEYRDISSDQVPRGIFLWYAITGLEIKNACPEYSILTRLLTFFSTEMSCVILLLG